MHELADASGNGSGQHYVQSVLRERIIEHVFVGEALRRLWQRGVVEVELLRSEFDAGGYDLVLSHKAVVRHIQLKSVIEGGRADSITVNMKLAQKPSGCIVWVVVDKSLAFRAYRWFGDLPGKPLPDIWDRKDAKQTRANAEGVKQVRLGHKVVHRRDFEELGTLDAVLERLFGELPSTWSDE